MHTQRHKNNIVFFFYFSFLLSLLSPVMLLSSSFMFNSIGSTSLTFRNSYTELRNCIACFLRWQNKPRRHHHYKNVGIESENCKIHIRKLTKQSIASTEDLHHVQTIASNWHQTPESTEQESLQLKINSSAPLRS